MSLDPELLSRALARMAGGALLPVSHLARLSGGANMESWSFDWGGTGYVLRLAPSKDFMEGRAFGHDVEAALVRAAFQAGVKAPEVMGVLVADDGLGSGYLMRRVEADVSPGKILANPPPGLLTDCARELARIHAVPLDGFDALPRSDAGSQLADLQARFQSYGGDRPVFALALRWLSNRLPTPVSPVLVHGDFRMGNLMVDTDGLAAVLDWELARVGDRHQDLAYGCINSWRFGHIDQPAFGCGEFDALWAAYEAQSGVPVDPDRFRWWLVFSTLWWGLCCLQMADIWRSGLDASLERAVIGRRASETEVDLLLLLETDAPAEENQPIAFPDTPAQRRAGEPSTLEMLEALARWIDTDVKSKASGRDRFMAAVALNALGMLQREAVSPADVHDKRLCDALIAGEKGLDTPGLLARLKRASLMKLAADQPKYSALKVAQGRWLTPP